MSVPETDNFNPQKTPSIVRKVLAVLYEYRLLIFGLSLMLVGVVVYLERDISLSRSQKLVAYTAVVFAPVGWLLGGYIASLLYSPKWIYLIDFDSAVADGAIFRYPVADFNDVLEVTTGEIARLAPNLYLGKNVDFENHTVAGVWLGTYDDRELARAFQKVRECREQLEEDAKRGFVLETSAFTIIRRASQSAVKSVVRTFESGTLPDKGHGLDDAVDDALAQFDVADELEREMEKVEKGDLTESGDDEGQKDISHSLNESLNGDDEPENVVI